MRRCRPLQARRLHWLSRADPLTIDDCVAALREVADRVRRTASLRRRDPAAWLEERDELANEIRRLAGRLAREHGSERLRAPAKPVAAGPARAVNTTVVTPSGRLVPVTVRRRDRFPR